MKLPIWLKDYRFFQIFILALFSGMPFSILYTSLIVWMQDYGVELATITTFAIARTPYSAKVFWSPALDYFNIPFLARLGRRKSWMILSLGILSFALLAISFLNPSDDINFMRFIALVIGIMAATYDMSFDAFRITILSEDEQAIGAATAVLAWRLGAFITGAGALFVIGKNIENWNLAFRVMAILFALAVCFIFTIKEAVIIREITGSFADKINEFVIVPFSDILSRKGAVLILASIVCYKMGEALLGFVSVPFYKEMGYSNDQIAVLVKSYGLIAILMGTYVGGIVIYKFGDIRGMIICGILQSVSNLMYLWLHYAPVANSSLLITVSIDNFTGGMGSTALIGYLSALCNKNYSATQYALLSSLATLINSTLSATSGSLIASIGWDNFFIMTVLLEIPALILLIYVGKINGFYSSNQTTNVNP